MIIFRIILQFIVHIAHIVISNLNSSRELQIVFPVNVTFGNL